MTPGDLLRFPQALAIREKAQEAAPDDEDLVPRIEEALGAAIESLDAMRTTEGGILRADLDATGARAPVAPTPPTPGSTPRAPRATEELTSPPRTAAATGSASSTDATGSGAPRRDGCARP